MDIELYVEFLEILFLVEELVEEKNIDKILALQKEIKSKMESLNV